MKLYSAAQMRDADARAVTAGVPTERLMDAAGAGAARCLLEAFPRAQHVVLLCGRGNNGGDGYVAAGYLSARGVKVTLYELEGERAGTGDAAAARAAYVAAGGQPHSLTEHTYRSALAQVEALAPGSGGQGDAVVIDALFGTGLSRPLAGWLGELVEGLAPAGLPVVSVDVPSGLNADLAEPTGPHVTADLTVELAGRKPASLFFPNRRAYGRCVLLDIGVPAAALEAASDVVILSAGHVAPLLPALDPAGHKYSAGTVCVVAGSPPYLGAAELACRAAWRGGAGLVTLTATERFGGAWPETVFRHLEPGAWPPAGLEARSAGAMVVGPGLAPASLPALPAMLAWAPGPVVLDAGALEPGALLAAGTQLREVTAVLTPHAGEAARLLEAASSDGATEHGGALVGRDPLHAAGLLAQLHGAVVVLKGPTTVVSHPDGRTAVSTRGAPAMATGGTGDVLAGLLGALLARRGGAEHAFERACLAVWLHGRAGELAAKQLGESLVASDVVAYLPPALAELAN
ncbi:MAG: NAD(P)H-hydrate dehydratase [Trueperaceae bacterium]